MFFTMGFLNLIDGGRLDAEEPFRYSDIPIMIGLVLGIIVTVPLDIVTSPIQGLVYCFRK